MLIDTGLGTQDVTSTKERLGRLPLALLRPLCDRNETALAQVRALGFDPKDLRHIVVTHLDYDHAGGLADFPHATVHVSSQELAAATHPRSFMERVRYKPVQWEHDPHWALHEPDSGEPWYGFDCVRQLKGLPPEILMVPLYGHTRGHAGVAVQSPKGWLFHAGDAYFFRGELDPDRRRCPPALDLLQRAVQVDGVARLQNQARLRQLTEENSNEVRVFCAHDPVEFDRLAASRERSGRTR